jgi:predicted  nucleic acid-binding Zn ribbon protein
METAITSKSSVWTYSNVQLILATMKILSFTCLVAYREVTITQRELVWVYPFRFMKFVIKILEKFHLSLTASFKFMLARNEVTKYVHLFWNFSVIRHDINTNQTIKIISTEWTILTTTKLTQTFVGNLI